LKVLKEHNRRVQRKKRCPNSPPAGSPLDNTFQEATSANFNPMSLSNIMTPCHTSSPLSSPPLGSRPSSPQSECESTYSPSEDKTTSILKRRGSFEESRRRMKKKVCWDVEDASPLAQLVAAALTAQTCQ